MKFRHCLEVPLLVWSEYRSICLAKETFVCSDLDCHYLEKLYRLPGIVTIPNAVSIPLPTPVPESPTLLFLGTYRYRPNVEAVEFLLDKIWPRIRTAAPNANLIVAGSLPERIRFFNSETPGVEFTGYVSDLDMLYGRSRVICCPVQSGSGTRIKILEAAAYGRPIVATSIGAYGLQMKEGRDLLVCDDPRAFADACVRLLRDTALCNRLGEAAKATVSRYYTRNSTVELIRQRVLQIANSPRTPKDSLASRGEATLRNQF